MRFRTKQDIKEFAKELERTIRLCPDTLDVADYITKMIILEFDLDDKEVNQHNEQLEQAMDNSRTLTNKGETNV